MQNVLDFVGRFHPLIVHLPIGILLLAVVFQFMLWRDATASLEKALKISLSGGAFSAVFACLTGYLLSQTADYDEQIVWWHQWLGVAIAVISLLWLYLLRRGFYKKWLGVSSSMVLVLLLVTGHLGGTLTHGEDYLSIGGFKDTLQVVERKPIANVQQAVAYTEIVKPLLSNSCYSCHGEKKQKGKLRLDMPEFIMKGGKNGEIIDTAALAESEIVKRLLLPVSDKKHMPPKDKRQLTKDEISLLHWWVESGASFDKKVGELPQTGKMVSIIATLEKPQAAETAVTMSLPEKPVAQAPKEAMETLKKRGIVVLPVSSTSNYLAANFVSTENVNDNDLKLLIPISDQLISLKVGDSKITDSGLSFISKCRNLVTLHLQHTDITDKGLVLLNELKDLQDLNLAGTNVTTTGVQQLKQLKKLKNVYLYETRVPRTEWKQLQASFPSTRLDSGGYNLPLLEGDTSMVKPLVKKKT